MIVDEEDEAETEAEEEEDDDNQSEAGPSKKRKRTDESGVGYLKSGNAGFLTSLDAQSISR
jgi:hypothetical protein